MIEVCIGSACHLKGSYDVIKRLKELLEEYEMTEKVELKSAFCLGSCGDGVSIRINNHRVHSISPEYVDAFFFSHIVEA